MDYSKSPSKSTLIGEDPQFMKQKLKESIIKGDVFVGEGDYKTRLIEKLAGGSFGEVYIGCMSLNNKTVAVKFEPQKSWIIPTLMNEGRFYRKLGDNVERIPILHWFGFYNGGEYAAMVMDLLGPSLYDLWLKCDQEFSLKTMLTVIQETISCLQVFHSKNCIHRDISPSNFAIGRGEKSSIFHILDFGNAIQLSTNQNFMSRGKPNIYASQDRAVIGTPRFISSNTHFGQPPSFRDDLESLGFVWVYLIKGRLPWQGIRIKANDGRMELIGRRKREIPLEEFCDGLPEEFTVFFQYVRSLAYMEMPNYDWLKGLFENLAFKLKVELDGKFDWNNNLDINMAG